MMYHECSLGGGDRYYSPKYSVLHEDGLLAIKASGWEDGETHWTGWITLLPSDIDYGFWYWMAHTQRVTELVQERELSRWKATYGAQINRSGSQTVMV